MFRRILIANRGEIAQRIIRACRELGVESVAVYSEADAGAIYLRQADDTICIGPPPGALSYLAIPSIIAAAEIADVEAIHPGYGFLAENAHFAEVCRSCQITFIGPDPETISAVGDKANARSMAMQADVPVVPGSEGPVADEEQAKQVASQIGYPVMIKACSGGGGRGMRIARNDPSLASGFRAASSEAEAAFGDGTVYIEKYVENTRHVEVQILADGEGNIVHLGERDCSIQRRHQKLIEECPSVVVDQKLREEMGAVALRAAAAVDYEGAGTVEFLWCEGEFHFLEMNTRLQVEHPVTEATTHVDLVQHQIRVAANERLALQQVEIKFSGHAIECRINAEDPEQDFRPSPGRLEVFELATDQGPGVVRVDTHLEAGDSIPVHYDSLIAKVIAHAGTREQAILTLVRALKASRIEGVQTTLALHLAVLESPAFTSGDYDTSSIPGWTDAKLLRDASHTAS